MYVHDLDLFVTVQVLDEHASSSIAWSALFRTRMFMRVEKLELHDWPKMGRQLL